MKYAFTSFSCPDLDFAALIAAAERFGYDGLEPRIGSGHAHGIELDTPADRRREIEERAAAAGIALCCLATSCTYIDPRTAEARVAETREAIALAADIGAPLLRVFAGVIPEGVGREEARERVAAALRVVADEAAARGVTVCVETHDDWSDPREMAEIMRRVDHPAVATVWDVMHPLRTGGATMDEAFAILRPWVRHVHIHDGSARPDRREFVPIGRGDLDHRRVLALLAEAGYDGFLSGEWIAGWMPDWAPYETYLPRELATMRRYERELFG